MVVREPEAGWWEAQARATVTVVAVFEGDTCHSDVVARLAEVATDDELLVVFGSSARSVQHWLVAELRARLPRRVVLPMRVRHRHDDLLPAAAIVEELLNAGRLPVVVTSPTAMHDVTAEIASYLRADRVLRVLGSDEGADLYAVWRRQTAQAVRQ
jgi:precorrin-6B methylase 1